MNSMGSMGVQIQSESVSVSSKTGSIRVEVLVKGKSRINLQPLHQGKGEREKQIKRR